MPEGFDVVQVKKGANVNVCQRCGAVIVDTHVHRKWHDAGERMATLLSARLTRVEPSSP